MSKMVIFMASIPRIARDPFSVSKRRRPKLLSTRQAIKIRTTTKTGESSTTFPATKGCGMSWRLTANRWKKCFRTPISSTSAKVDKSSTQTILRNPDLSHGRRIFRRMVLRAVIWTNKFSQTDCAGRTLSSGFSSCPWLKTKIDGWTMDKQISMSSGAKSNIKINGQTNSVLFVHWFIEFYLLCDCSIFVLVH